MKGERESQLIRYLGNNMIHRGKNRGQMLWNDIFKMIHEKKKKKTLPIRILCPAKLSSNKCR